MRILVAYDGGEPAKRALDMAIALAEPVDGTIDVVSVIPVHPGRIAVDPWDDRDAHAAELAEAEGILTEHGFDPELIEPAGEVGPTIERIATEGGYDMVVVGSRGLGSVARIFQASVSEHVATHAGSTVVIAR